ncbi:MAG: ABC transporter ATP-binding protein [Candidatus Poribacteria bacterium]|nr:MAG: ABC transporter ATP-binding protein [Candidatus Poribacteria bacterium]
MSQIVVEGLTKTYQIAEREPGPWGAVRGLFRRRYRRVVAVRDVSFSVESGELIGYVGPNGAGKSTTIKILAGILVPDSGRCRVLGRVPWRERVAHTARIGVVFGQRTQLWWDLPVIESFELLRDIYRVPETVYRKHRDELVDRLELSPLLDTPVRQLSLGQRMRCDLAAALLHGPAVLFLDEPTIGLDAASKLAVRDFLWEINRERNVTILLTTHDMDDIEALCSRVIVIADGEVFYDGSLEGLRARVTNERRLIVDLEDPGLPLRVEGAVEIQREGHRRVLSFDPTKTPTPLLIADVTAKYPVRDLFVENPPIEEIVAQLYRDRER